MATCYLIDFENVHDSGLKGVDQLGYDDCVFIFYTAFANKISLNALENIQAGLRVIRTPEGNQSLDRHLISYLGFLLGQESDPETRYQVISKDNGYRQIIEFWNRWFGSDEKVKQRACIGCQAAVADPVPYFMPDGRSLNADGIELRRAIIRYMENHGEKSLNGHWYMMVSSLCAYLNDMDAYCSERIASGKKPMAFLKENLNDILAIRSENGTDMVYLITDREYRELPEFDLPDLAGETPVGETSPAKSPEPEQETAAEAEDESNASSQATTADDPAELAFDEACNEPIEAITRATFENDSESDSAGHRRVKASLLRDRLEKLDGYRRAQRMSGKKPLEYLAEVLDGKVLIRSEKGRSWAYPAEDEILETEMTEDDLTIPDVDFSSDDGIESTQQPAPSPCVEEMDPIEKAVYWKMISTGKDATTAAAVALTAAASMLSAEPKSEFHSRLWKQFGQKLGTRYYRDASSVLDEQLPSRETDCLPVKKHSQANQQAVTIDEMNLSKRTANRLKGAGYHTAAEFIGKSNDELMKIRNLGQKGIDEIREWVRTEMGITSLVI